MQNIIACDIIQTYKIPCDAKYLANTREGSTAMQTQLKRGTLEMCVLTILRRGDRYGYELVNLISDAMHITEGTIYPLMKRLKDSGSIESYIVESQEGPPRKYYRITDSGIEIQKEQEAEWRSFVAAVNRLIEGEGNGQ